LDESRPFTDAVIVIGVKADLVDVGRFRPIDMADRHGDQLQFDVGISIFRHMTSAVNPTNALPTGNPLAWRTRRRHLPPATLGQGWVQPGHHVPDPRS